MKQLFTLLLLALLFASCQQKPQLAEWRGPNRSGIYPETNLLKSWPETGPVLIWETESIGNGYSSPIVADDFLYITGEVDSLGYLFKFDHHGKEIWRSTYGTEWTINFPGSRGAPTFYGDHIYICSGKGDIACLNAESGDLVWHKNLIDDFNGVNPRFGFSQALAVDGDKLFCLPGGEEYNVVALNRLTGELIWSNKCFEERPGYNSPKLIEWGGKKILVTFSAYHLLGVETETGELLWSHEQTNTKPEERTPGNGDTHANTVLFDNGFIYYAAADGNGGVKLKLNEDATAIEEIWKTPILDNYMGGLIKIDNKLYTSSHGKQHLMALDCDSAEKMDSLKLGRGSTIFADGMIYFFSEKGMVHLVDLTNSGLKDVSSFKIEKGSKEYFAHPVIHNGVLYVRHGKYLGAFDIKI